MNGLPERVQPGDLITADLMNGILARLSTPLVINLGPLGAGTRTLVALGGGFEGTGGIWLDGVSLLPGQPARGINLVILDASLNLKFRQSYDTFGSGAASTDLINGLQRANQYDVVAVVTADAYLNQLNADAKKALASVGGAALGNPGADTRASGAFIGVVPALRANASFDYLTSVLPADGPGFGSATLTAPPFAWGIYSIPLKRFLMGGASSNTITVTPKPKDNKETKDTKETKETTKELAKEVAKEVAKEIAKEIDNKLAIKETDVTPKVSDTKLSDVTPKVSDTKLSDAKLSDVTPKVSDVAVNPGSVVTNPAVSGGTIGGAVVQPGIAGDIGGAGTSIVGGVGGVGNIGNIAPIVNRGIEPQPASGEAFIQPSERPDVGKAAVRASKGKANARRRRKSK